jgi:hypothetical protein
MTKDGAPKRKISCWDRNSSAPSLGYFENIRAAEIRNIKKKYKMIQNYYYNLFYKT